MEVLIFLFLLILLGTFLFGAYSIAEGRQPELRRVSRTRRTTRRTPQPSRAARRAMRQAGYQYGPEYVQIRDIGLLAYRTSQEKKLVRYGDVMLDTNYLRPFVELWVPFRSQGNIRFELIDSDGRVRYADEDHYDLTPGDNNVLPGTWLPLQGTVIEPKQWRLRVSASEVFLAEHVFGWQPVGGGHIQRYAESDGEISPELRRLAQSSAQQQISLEDLLSHQEDEV